ncbi:hypothetical protein [Mesorhizobium atlanticum]|nr:hypothetical protein [Mesorhizobium atlanticum]
MKLLLGCRFCGLRDLEPPIEIWAINMAGYKWCQSAKPAGAAD